MNTEQLIKKAQKLSVINGNEDCDDTIPKQDLQFYIPVYKALVKLQTELSHRYGWTPYTKYSENIDKMIKKTLKDIQSSIKELEEN